MKTIWQSKKSSKSVGSLFNQFNAFWALSYILINILALFLYMTTTNGFYKGVCFGLFISKNEFCLAQGEEFLREKWLVFITYKKRARILKRTYRSIQKMLNWLKKVHTELELCKCRFKFIQIAVQYSQVNIKDIIFVE